jgi:hypothetical protein
MLLENSSKNTLRNTCQLQGIDHILNRLSCNCGILYLSSIAESELKDQASVFSLFLRSHCMTSVCKYAIKQQLEHFNEISVKKHFPAK